MSKALGWAVFHGPVRKGREERDGQLHTLMEKPIANVDPPGVFAASVACHGTCANSHTCEEDIGVCVLARHTCEDDARRVPGARRSGRPAHAGKPDAHDIGSE